ncbi:MAG: 5-methyltetrahydropteroyltriglutamate--homocysteine S-methyltransferase [Stellaceae bacterium]
MPAAAKPPFRADHVGSLLRPPEVHEARARKAKGEIDAAALRRVEDAAIRKAVALQESAGLQAITDGEFRRGFWHVDFLTGFSGIVPTQSNWAVKFIGEGGASAETRSMLAVTDTIRRVKSIAGPDFEVLKAATARTPKLCIPAPTYLHLRGGRNTVSRTAYPDMEGFWSDIIAAYRAEIADLAARGLTYLQLDDVTIAFLCDEDVRAQLQRDGEDPAKLPALYADVINRIVKDRPASLAVTIHTCRGNHLSMWMASGGYDAVAETIFGGLQLDGIFLEYDSERAGSFEPLRFVRKGMRVVLGLVSTKTGMLESKDALKRRIDEAAKYVPLENLCLSPQCGFASTEAGNKISEDIERRKLALVVEVANEVWSEG